MASTLVIIIPPSSEIDKLKNTSPVSPPGPLTLGPVLGGVERQSTGEEAAGGVPRVPVENYQQQRVDEGVNERNVKSYLAITLISGS